MKRDLTQLTERPFDLLVIGGGVYGAWTAADAAMSGLTVAIIDKDDWAAGTSSASSKMIHGGLRYLEHFNFGLVRHSLAERRLLWRIAPHRILPTRFAVPIYRDSRVGRVRLKLGLWLYDRLAGSDQPVGPHESLSREQLLERCPPLDGEGLLGGFSYGDCVSDDARMTLEVIAAAVNAGAAAANHVEATRLIERHGAAAGATVRDAMSGEPFDIRAKVVVAATGPWIRSSLHDHVTPPPVRLTKGVHLVMPALQTDHAMLLTARRDGRVFFAIPWYGRTLLGTTDTNYEGEADRCAVEEADVDYLLSEANRVVGAAEWTRDSICGRFAGLRTLRHAAGPFGRLRTGRAPSSLSRDWQLAEPIPNLLAPIGGKFTTARYDAQRIVDRAFEIVRGKQRQACPTDNTPLPWSPPFQEFASWKQHTRQASIALGMDEQTAETTSFRHGTAIERIHDLIRGDASLAQRLSADLPFCRAEVVSAARDEMALSLEDVLRRRLPLLIVTRANQGVIEDAAELAGDVLHWSTQQRREEVETIMNRAGA